MDISFRLWQAAEKLSSVCGRTARMSYAEASWGRRWCCDGSVRTTVARRRMVGSFGGEEEEEEGNSNLGSEFVMFGGIGAPSV